MRGGAAGSIVSTAASAAALVRSYPSYDSRRVQASRLQMTQAAPRPCGVDSSGAESCFQTVSSPDAAFLGQCAQLLSERHNFNYENNSMSLHLDTNSLLTRTRGRRRRRESSFSYSLPRLFQSTSTPTHSNIRFTFSIYPYYCPHLMTLLTFLH